MIKAISCKKSRLSILFTTITIFALSLPSICCGMDVDVSPNIINIESNRLGEIRIFTDLSYSTYMSHGVNIFVYFNGGGDSVDNIRATRDSWGNLIVKFDIEDLLVVKDYLVTDAYNDVEVVVGMTQNDDDGGYYEVVGFSVVYIADKKAP